MSKWHEYGETPNTFPEVWDTPECGEFYDAEYVKDWIKRAIEDLPKERGSTWMEEDLWEYRQWFQRWFSQFIEKGEENV